MTPKDSDSFSDGDWDDSEELGWSELDWDKYLRKQDEAIHRYLGFYEGLVEEEDRLDKVARLMNWDLMEDNEDEEDPEGGDDEMDEMDPYILQRNPVFIAASALYLSLSRDWERIALDGALVAPSLSLPLLSSLSRGERHMVLGVQALDLGDYTMAICLFKRAMRELNGTLSHVNGPEFTAEGELASFHDRVLPRLFDLREVLLRVITEAREELSRHSSKPGDDEDGGEKRGQG